MEILSAYTPGQIVAVLIAAFGSAFVRGLTGFGMAILLVPILALALNPVEAVLFANFLSICIGMSEIRRLVRGAESSAWLISLIVLLTAPFGFVALFWTSVDAARLIIALIAFCAFAVILLPSKAHGKPGPVVTGGVGVLSGLMTGYAGMPGPPVVPYYLMRNLPRETAKSSMMLIFTIAPFAGLVSGAMLGILDWRLAVLAILLFPAVLLGNALGNRVSGRISDMAWRIAVAVVLAGAAIAAFVRLI